MRDSSLKCTSYILGTMLVNGIVASCYANIKDHDMA